MQKIKTTEFWRKLIILVLGVSLIPILGIAFYNHSSADDYSFGCLTRYAWVDTQSIWEVLRTVGEKVHSVYFEWQGSYAAVALFALQPAVFGEKLYVLVTYVIMGIFLFGTFHFFRKIVGLMIKDNTQIADIIAGVVAILSIQLLPSPVEGFFWWNGASYYVIFYSLMLIQLADLAVIIYQDKCSKRQFALLLIMAVLIAGGNYISALLTMELTAFFSVYSFFKKKKITGKMFVVLSVTLVGFLTNCLAPGNAVRQSAFEAWSPIRAILYSFHEAYNYMIEWTSPLLIVGMIFLIPFLWYLPIKNIMKGYLSYMLLMGMGFAVFASSFTPTLYAYGEVGAGRVQNIRYFLWILFSVLVEIIVICCIKNMIINCEGKIDGVENILRNMYLRYAIPFFVTILTCSLFFVANSVLADDVRDMVSISAVKSLLSGEAKQYDREMNERIETLLGEEKSVVLSPLSCHPELLFWEDIKEDSAEWINGAVARFYGKDEVSLQGSD